MENMSRDSSRPRSNSSVDRNVQKVLNLDSSPGSSRKICDGESERIHIPNFSEEVLSDFEDETNKLPVESTGKSSENQLSSHNIRKPIVLKSILKRRIPNQQRINVTEVQRNTKCCHPLVNKIRLIADKTLQKLERNETEKMYFTNDQKIDSIQEIKQLKCSPGASRRQKFGTIKLGDSDEMSKSTSLDIEHPIKNKNHIYEDIEEKTMNPATFQKEIFTDNESHASQDPSLVSVSIQPEEPTIKILHVEDNDKMSEPDENFDDQFRNETNLNITTTARVHSESEPYNDESNEPIEMALNFSPLEIDTNLNEVDLKTDQWSKSSSDHEYEIIEKLSPNIVYDHSSANQISTEDELFISNTLNQNDLSQTPDEEKSIGYIINLNSDISEDVYNTESIQENTKDRYLTPSVVTEPKCEVSNDQVDSTALKNVPIKCDNKVQDRFKEGTRKLKTQAKHLKSKLHNLKSKQFKIPERGKINFPQRPLFSFPQRPKLSIPHRPKKDNKPEDINIDNENVNVKKRSSYSIPDFSKFKVPRLPNTYFSKICRKKDDTVKPDTLYESSSNEKSLNSDTGEIKRKSEHSQFSFLPILNRDNMPSRDFSSTRPKKLKKNPLNPSFTISPKETQEYEAICNKSDGDGKMEQYKQFDSIYDFRKSNPEYGNESETLNFTKNENLPSIPLEEQEINNYKFDDPSREFLHENIISSEYLSDEIRQAFKMPRNVLMSMRSTADQEIEANENDSFQYSNDQLDVKHNRCYTFPPVRPSRVKNKIEGQQSIKYIDESVDSSKQLSEDNIDFTGYQDIHQESIQYVEETANARKQYSEDNIDFTEYPDINQQSIQYDDDTVDTSKQLSEVNIDFTEDQDMNQEIIHYIDESINTSEQFSETNSEFTEDQDIKGVIATDNQFSLSTDINCVHEYANDMIVHLDNSTIHHQAQPIPPKRMKKNEKRVSNRWPDIDKNNLPSSDSWKPEKQVNDIIVYQTQYEYINPQAETIVTEQCPVPPRRNRSLSSKDISLYNEEQTSHDTKLLFSDTHSPETGIFDIEREIRCDNSEYATVNKRPYLPIKSSRRSKSKTPPARHRKSNSSERKYYTVELSKTAIPSRPIRKKSSSSLTTFDDFKERSNNNSFKLFVENSDAKFVEEQKGLNSCEIMSKMKDRPLPPPPRPPRGSKKMPKVKDIHNFEGEVEYDDTAAFDGYDFYSQQQMKDENVVEVEVSTQTDQLPDNVNFEIVINKNQDIPMYKSNCKVTEGSRSSCPRSEHSYELSGYFNTERTSPSVILIERNVSSPTRINERDEILTEASLIVQHIDINEPQTPHVLSRPKSDTKSSAIKNMVPSNDDQTREIIAHPNKELIIDKLVTQRLHVKDLDVSHLNVSELQADKLHVSQTNEVDHLSTKISQSGIEISQFIIDEFVKKFSEMKSTQETTSHTHYISDTDGSQNKEEQTQTDWSPLDTNMQELLLEINKTGGSSPSLSPLPINQNQIQFSVLPRSLLPPRSANADSPTPQIPIPPKLTPLLYSYFQDTPLPPASFYSTRSARENQLSDINDLHQFPSHATQRDKGQSAAPSIDSNSDEDRPHPPTLRAHELTITEAGAQFMSVCQKSISRIFKSIFKYCISYLNATEDKKDMQMALVIFLVLIAGLVMFGLSDLRTIHHHHWEFFNPPDGTQRPL